MSRSRRKTPISGVTTADSNKEFKAQEHRRERRSTKVLLLCSPDVDLPDSKKWGNEWASPRDGKIYWGYDDRCTTCKYGPHWLNSYGLSSTSECDCEEHKADYAKWMRK